MGRSCALRACRNRDGKEDRNVKCHFLPASEDMRKEWNIFYNKCNRTLGRVLSKNNPLCSDHFENKYYSEFGQLMKGAVPTIAPKFSAELAYKYSLIPHLNSSLLDAVNDFEEALKEISTPSQEETTPNYPQENHKDFECVDNLPVEFKKETSECSSNANISSLTVDEMHVNLKTETSECSSNTNISSLTMDDIHVNLKTETSECSNNANISSLTVDDMHVVDLKKETSEWSSNAKISSLTVNDIHVDIKEEASECLTEADTSSLSEADFIRRSPDMSCVEAASTVCPTDPLEILGFKDIDIDGKVFINDENQLQSYQLNNQIPTPSDSDFVNITSDDERSTPEVPKIKHFFGQLQESDFILPSSRARNFALVMSVNNESKKKIRGLRQKLRRTQAKIRNLQSFLDDLEQKQLITPTVASIIKRKIKSF